MQQYLCTGFAACVTPFPEREAVIHRCNSVVVQYDHYMFLRAAREGGWTYVVMAVWLRHRLLLKEERQLHA